MTAAFCKRMKRRLPAIALLLLCAPRFATAAQREESSDSTAKTWHAAVRETRRDILLAEKELQQARERIASERLERVRALEDLKQEVSRLSATVEGASERRRQLETDLDELKSERDFADKLVGYLTTVASEHLQTFDAQLGSAEAAAMSGTVSSLNEALATEGMQEQLAAAEQILRTAAEHAESSLGGRRFPGSALTGAGTFVPGTFVQMGPVAYFAGSEGTAAGLVVQSRDSTLPGLFSEFDKPERLDAIRDLVADGTASPPLDPTQGSAVRLATAKDSIWDHLKKGRAVMIPLLLLAAVCVVLGIYKCLSLKRIAARHSGERLEAILAALNEGSEGEAIRLAEGLRRPLGPVLREGILHRTASKEHIEEILHEQILMQVPALERFLAPLAVCASAAPLLGLLGTVTGMIHTFRLITVFGTGDARLLSSGISEALITTEIGLVIAIPTLLLHAYLSRRVRRAVAVTQQSAVAFVNGLKLRSPQR